MTTRRPAAPRSLDVKSGLDELASRRLGDWVDAVSRHARPVAVGISVLTLLLGAYAARNLGVNSDNLRLVSADLPFMRHQARFAEQFPILDNALLIVVDAETPELARASADALAARLAARPERFEDVYFPAGADFFQEHGLLYRTEEELDEFSAAMARVQPILAELESDPSIANLARLVRLGLEQVQSRGGDPEEWPGILRRVGDATVAVYQEYPLAISWEELLLRGSALEVTTRQVIVAHPVLEFGDVLAAGQALADIRAAADALLLDARHGVRVRVTGNPALNYEEMVGLLWDIGVSGVFCFLLVALLIYLALRSVPIVVAALVTLLAGLIWTAAFAAAAVGDLNLISIAFAILFIGLGVDFGIHLGMRYADRLAHGRSPEAALREAAQDVGGSLVLCTVTTAIGFYVFVPTDYRGVAELGLISGTGMLVILFLTLTFFPALLASWLRVDVARQPSTPLRFRHAWWRGLERHPRAVRWAALVAAAGALLLLPQVRFDPHVIDMRNPNTESVQAFNDLLADSGHTSPWFVNVVAPDLERARALAKRLEALDAVDHTITLADYVPENQDAKLEILRDVGMLLDVPLAVGTAEEEEPSTSEQVEALRDLHDFLDAEWMEEGDSSLASSMRYLRYQLGRFLKRIEEQGNEEEALRSLESILLSNLPRQVERLRKALDPSRVSLEELPPDLVSRMIAPDGSARIQVFPRENLQDGAALERFADAVRTVAPDAVGVSINLVEFGRATVASFQQALVSAVVAIALLLLLLWGRVTDAAFALAPLLLATACTGAVMVLLDQPFNFANVIVLPLLFGIGVDSAIHLVHQSRVEAAEREDLLATTTARAVFYSAVTTTASFGSLAFSSHRGMASLGLLLVVGMVLHVVANLVVLPALLELRRR